MKITKIKNKIVNYTLKKPIKRILKFFNLSITRINKKTNIERKRKGRNRENPSTLSICFIENGGLGDCLMLFPFINEVYKKSPCIIEIDVYSRFYEIFKNLNYIHVFKNLTYLHDVKKTPEEISDLIYDYDVVFLVFRRAQVLFANKEKVKKLYPKLQEFIYTSEKLKALSEVCNNIHLLNEFSLIHGAKRQRQIDIFNIFNIDINKPYYSIKASEPEILKNFDLANKKYITLSRGTDNCYNSSHPKLWPLDYYEKLVYLLKRKFPDIFLIQIGASKNYGIINGTDMNLVGKTNFDEVAILLKNSLLHIDGEGGLVHLNHAVGGKSCVLFGPTNPLVFGYPENINLRSDVCPTTCDWIVTNWALGCIKGEDYPAPCMKNLKPEIVFNAIKSNLKHHNNNSL